MINPGIAYIDCTDFPAIALTGPTTSTGVYTGTITNAALIKKLMNTNGKITCIKNWKYTNSTITSQIPSGMLDGIYMQAVANGKNILKAACGGAGTTTRVTARAITVDIILDSDQSCSVVVTTIDMGTSSAQA